MAKTLFQYTEGNAPATTDYCLTGQDPAGLPAMRRLTWATIRNLFVGAPTAANDFPVSIDGANYVKRTLAQTKTILGVDALPGVDGWTPAGVTWTYASATTFTITGDYSAIFTRGMKWKATNTTAKSGYILSSVYSSPNTTVTICGDALANAAISANYYSNVANPSGFQHWFSAAAPTFNVTYYDNGSGGQPTTTEFKFSINGRTLIAHYLGSGVKAVTDPNIVLTGAVSSSFPLPDSTTAQTVMGAAITDVLNGLIVYGANPYCRFSANIADNTVITAFSFNLQHQI